MSISKQEVLSAISRIAPEGLAEEWDNCGMQVDLGRETVSRILVTLEINGAVVEEGKREGVDFIITHHPLIFSGIKRVDSGKPGGSAIIELIRAGISVYSAHTSFDAAQEGNNIYLSKLLGLSDVCRLRKPTDAEGAGFLGIMGQLEPTPFYAVCEMVKRVLALPAGALRRVGDGDRLIQKVGLCTGAGMDFMEDAVRAGCDLFLTGDVKYHDAMEAKAMGICLIDAGHYGTERIFSENFASQLERELGNGVEILQSSVNLDPFS